MFHPLSASLVAASCLVAANPCSADPVTETVMHDFANADGAFPGHAAPMLGKDGNLYGVTEQGGTINHGEIYRLAPDGTETALYSFLGTGDGDNPSWSLARDVKGNFYGMTDPDGSGTNRGTVFRITEAGVFKTLYQFPYSGANGWTGENAITVGADGYLYGVTYEGGTYGEGTFFRLKTDGTQFTVLFNFGEDAEHTAEVPIYPQGGVVQGSDGNFYGLANYNAEGSFSVGFGAAYRITPAGALTPLYFFNDPSMEPPAGMPTLDPAGNLYFFGDIRSSPMTGRIYKLDPSNTLTTLHQFATAEGAPAYSSQLLLAPDGRLYGTAYDGGPTGNWASGPGTVFGLALDGTFAVLHDFGLTDGDGTNPEAGLAVAKDGSLWGTTRAGGSASRGTAYRLTPPTEKLSVKPTSIASGKHATLKWTSTDTAACSASGAWGPAAEATSGSQIVSPSVPGTYTYTLTCTGAGTVAHSVKLVVTN